MASLLLYHDLGEVRDSRELPPNRTQQRPTVSPQVLLRTVHQDVDEKSVERRRDRCDRLQSFRVSARRDQLFEQGFRLEEVRGERALGGLAIEPGRGVFELLGPDDVADALER